MLSFLLNLPNSLGIDPVTGKVLGGEKIVKKVVKKVAKKATKAAVDAATQAAAAVNEAATQATPVAPEVVQEPVDETPSAFMEFLSSLDPTITAIVVGLVLIIAFIIYRRRFSSTGQVGDTFLLLGAMGSGKTTLYYQLKQGLYRETYTSMKENDETFVVKPLEGKISSWRYVDLPGHASQRVKLDVLKSVSKGVVFVVDGSAPDSFGKVAQFLYTLLVDPVFTARKTPFFIAINKKDRIDDTATWTSEESTEDHCDADADNQNSAIDQIATRLEKILDKTRGLQSTMTDLGDGEVRVRTLGYEGEPFQFSHSVCPISYGGISASKGELDDLLNFLQAQ